MAQPVTVPVDDTYVIMSQLATDLTAKITDVHSDGSPVIILNKNDAININGINYLVEQVIKDNSTGFQAIIFKDQSSGISTLAVGGSYSAKNILNNPIEWFNDWILNNLLVGGDHLPPQLSSLITTLDTYKDIYNIQNATGFSQGAISLGLALKLSKYGDINGYLYNGGVPIKLMAELVAKYGVEVDPSSTNFITLLAQQEPLSTLLTWDKGGGIYQAIDDAVGHDLINLKSVTDYQMILQSGNSYADNINMSVSKSISNTGVQVKIDIPLADTVEKIKNVFSSIYNLLLEQKHTEEEDSYIKQCIKFEIENDTNLYKILTENDVEKLSNKYGVSEQELINENNWNDMNSDKENKFELISSDEQIVIPEGSIKGTDNSGIDKYLNDALNGNIHPDTIAPEGVTLPSSGKTENPVVEHYTSKPQMLSPDAILQRALKEGNVEALKSVIPNADKRIFDVLRFFATLPGNPLQNANINQALNNMLFGPIRDAFISGIYFNYPMAIDLDGEGIETVDINKSQIYFDVDNDGFREQTGWISKNEAA